MRKLGLYCGSFNPFHIGHLSIAQKAQNLFDDVIIARGTNSDKTQVIPHNNDNDFIVANRVHPEFKTIEYFGFTTDLIKSFVKRGYESTNLFLIRGIRSSHDYDVEMNQITAMKDMFEDLQVVMIPCDKQYEHVSSSLIRSIWKFDRHAADKYLVQNGKVEEETQK